MSIFGRIKDAIFGSATAKEATAAPSAAPAPGGAAAASSGATTQSAPGAATATAGATAAAMSAVDVEEVLTISPRRTIRSSTGRSRSST